MTTMTMKKSEFDSYAIKVKSVSGSLILVVNEDEGRPHSIQIYIGKTGSNLFAFSSALAELISFLLQQGYEILDIISLLSNTTSDKLVYNGDIPVRSDVDAIAYALMKYKKEKARAEKKTSRNVHFRRF